MSSFFSSTIKRVKRLQRRLAGSIYGHMRPRGMVIGAQKCGTTALYKYLSQHPHIVPSVKKELHFFNHDAHYAKGLDYYLRHFEANTPSRHAKITLDISPGYLQPSTKTAPRIYQFDPTLKLVALVRDPVYRAYSAWQMYKRFYERDKNWFFKWNEGFDQQAKPYLPRQHYGRSFYDDVKIEMDMLGSNQQPEMTLLEHGYYAQQLEDFLRLFSKEQLLIISSEEMKKDTPASLATLESFWGIAHHHWERSKTQPHFEGGYQEQPTPQEIELLRDFYAPHNEKLFTLLGKRFDWL